MVGRHADVCLLEALFSWSHLSLILSRLYSMDGDFLRHIESHVAYVGWLRLELFSQGTIIYNPRQLSCHGMY